MANFWENLTSPIKKAAQGVSDWWKKSQDEAEQRRKEQERLAEENRKKIVTATQNVGNFLKGTAEKISELPKEVSKDVLEYFEPVPDKVRVRDFVRELPGSTEKVGKGIGKFLVDVLRAMPRAAGQFTLTAEGQKEFVPGTGVAPKLEKFLFGDEPIHDIETTGKETVRAFGGSEKTASKIGMPVGLVLGTLDLIPGIPKKKIAEELGEQLITKYGDDIARAIIKKGGKELAEKALKEGGEKMVQKSGIAVKSIREILYNLPKELMPAEKASLAHSKLLWNTMRNAAGEANALGKDITENKGAITWIIDTLEGGKKALAPIAKKYGEQGVTSKQLSKLTGILKSNNFDIEGYKKVMATLKGIEPTVVEKAITPAKEAAEKAVKAIPAELKTLATEAGKYKTAEDFSKTLGVPEESIKSIKVFGSSVEGKLKPNDVDIFVTVKDGSMKFKKAGGLPIPVVKTKGKLNYFIMPESDAEDFLSSMLYTGRKDPERLYSGKTVAIDSLKDFYNQAIGKTEQAAKAATEVMQGVPSITPTEGKFLAKKADGTSKLFKTQDEAYKFLGLEEKETPKIPKTKTAEAELESINAKGQAVEKAGKKKALAAPRADQLKEPPATPPRVPEEIPLANAPKPPEGSALSAIDKMVGEKGAAGKIIDWFKQAPKKFTEAFSDRFAPMKRFEDELSKMAGQPIDINSSPYVAARMYAGRMGTVEAELQNLQKIVQPLAKDRADFTRYVLAKRAAERGSRGFANPGGVTEEQAIKAISELKTKVGDAVFRQFENAETAIQTWADQAILQPAVKSGILSKEAYEAVVKNNKHWIPFQVLDYLPDATKADTLRAGSEIFSVAKQGIIKGLEGTEKAIRDPFEAIIDRLSQSVSLVKRNEVAKKLVDLRNEFGQAKDLIVPLAKDAAPQKGWEALSVFVDGKVTKWAVPEELNWAMHQMNEAEAGLIGKFMRFTSGAFRKGATTLYIPFSLSNSIRDVQMAVMTSKYGFNAADWLKGFGNGLKAAFGWDSKLYEDFMKNAGGFGGFIQNARSISGAKEALFAPTWWRRTKAVINPFNLISNFAEATELAPRLGVYSKAVKKGATAFEAAFEARNATIDFAKSGQEMRIINMWIPFVNARWQALLNTARVFKERPVRSAAKAGALIVAPGVTTYLWNTMNYPDLYDDIPQWAKDTYFTIIVGEDVDKDGNRVPKVVQIPKGDVGQIFYNPIEYALDYVRKGEPQNFAKLGLEWMSQLAPIPFTRDGELSVSQVLSGGLPPILRTPIELATNQSFFSGYRIVPQNLEKVAPTEQYDEKTPTLAVTIGRALGISPMKLAYGISGLLGGFGKEAIDPAKILEMTTQRFYRTSGGAKRNEAWDVKYEAEVGYATARQQATRAIEAGDNETAYKIMDSWNAAAEKIVPEITPYLAKDDPLEAESIRKSVTFQPTDMARLQRSVTEKALSKSEEEKKIGKKTGTGLSQDELKKFRTGGQIQPVTMGQIMKTQTSDQLDLKSMREAVRR